MVKVNTGGIEEFQKLWREHFHTEISEEEAAEYSERLVRLVKILIDSEKQQKAEQVHLVDGSI